MTDKATQKEPTTARREMAPARRWAPSTYVRELEAEMDRLMDAMWPFARRPAIVPTRRPIATGTIWAPRMDVYQKDGSLVIKAELPGLKVEDVDVRVEDGDLIIQGERKAEQEVKEVDYHRMERSYGEFYRRQSLPEGIKPEQITASFADGVLEITIPAPRAAKPETHQIPIAKT